MSDEKKVTVDSDELRVIYVEDRDNESGLYAVTKTEDEAVCRVVADWGGDENDYDVDVLGPAPDGILDSNIVDGRIVKAELPLISWLLERLRKVEDLLNVEAKKVEAFQTQAIEHQVDVVAFRHDLEAAEYERDQARNELEESECCEKKVMMTTEGKKISFRDLERAFVVSTCLPLQEFMKRENTLKKCKLSEREYHSIARDMQKRFGEMLRSFTCFKGCSCPELEHEVVKRLGETTGAMKEPKHDYGSTNELELERN